MPRVCSHFHALAAVALIGAAFFVAACSGGGSGPAPSQTSANVAMQTTIKSTAPTAIGVPSMPLATGMSAAQMNARRPQGQILAPSWTQLSGLADYAAASPDGSLYVIANTYGGPGGNTIWHYVNGAWTQIPGAATRLTVAPDATLWALTGAGAIYHYVNGSWTTIAGGASDISIGSDGSMYVVSNAYGGPGGDTIWHYVNGAWAQLPGAGVTIAASWDSGTYTNVSPGGFYVTTGQGQIYYYNPGSGYALLSGSALQLAPTNAGGLFAVGNDSAANHGVWYEDLSTGAWVQEPGSAINLAVTSTTLYAVASNGSIWTSSVTPAPSPSPSSIAISSGGTYSGTWQSLDPKTPAVSINTSAAVTITNCTIRSKGELIRATVSNAHVTVTNCSGYALDPLVAGDLHGNFFSAYDIGSLDLEHNYIQGVNYGVQLYDADGWAPSGPIIVRYNSALNLQGAPSDGNGGVNLSNLAEPGDNQNHFVILADLQNLTGTDISWNYVENDPGVSSIGDVYDIYSSSGTMTSPILLHDNFILGGYPAVPNATLYWAGGMTMDGRATDTAATATAFVHIYNNQIVQHANFGIGLAAGHDVQAFNNRVVSSGQLADGTWFFGDTGMYIVNCSCYNQPPTVYFNNSAYNNTVGYQYEISYPGSSTVFSPPVVRQDYSLTDCAGGPSGPTSQCTNNASLPALPTLITSATVANEATLWQQKLTANNITVGPASTTTNATSSRRR